MIRLDDTELLDVFKEGADDEFDALNDEEQARLKELVQASDSGRTLAQKRWKGASQQALERKATLQQSTEAGTFPRGGGQSDLDLPGVMGALGENLSETIAPTGPDGKQRFFREPVPARPFGPFGPPINPALRLGANVATGLANVPLGMADIARQGMEVGGGHLANLAGVPGAYEATQENLGEATEMLKGMATFVADVAKNSGKAAAYGVIVKQFGLPPTELEALLKEHDLTPDGLVEQFLNNPVETIGTLASVGLVRGPLAMEAMGKIKGAAKVIGEEAGRGFSVGPLPKEPAGRVVGSPLAGVQDMAFPEGPVSPTNTPTWSNTAVALQSLPDTIKADSLINWLAKDAQRMGVSVPEAEIAALQLRELAAQHKGGVVSKAEVTEWVADRVVRTEERVLEANDTSLAQVPHPDYPDTHIALQYVDGPRAGQLVTDPGLTDTSPLAWPRNRPDYIRQGVEAYGRGVTKFDRPDLRLPGGENYREVLVKVPWQNELKPGVRFRHLDYNNVWRDVEIVKIAEDGATVTVADTRTGKQFMLGWDTARKDLGGAQFAGGHFDPNTLAHMRLTDRTVNVGGRDVPTLFSEEFQSDWSQAKRGGPGGREGTTVPDHPLLGQWKEVLFKRFLRKAAEEGKEAVAWTTGEQQKGRYDLGKKLKSLTAFQEDSGVGEWGLRGINERGQPVLDLIVRDSELENYVGKDVAAKIRGTSTVDEVGIRYATIDSVDLTIGGEWANKLYDTQMVDIANKWAKRFGGRVEKGNISTGKDPIHGPNGIIHKAYEGAFTVDGIPHTTFMSREAAVKAAKELLDKESVHTLRLTPEMRDSLLYEGQPTFGLATGDLAKAGKTAKALEGRGMVLGTGLGGAQDLFGKSPLKDKLGKTIGELKQVRDIERRKTENAGLRKTIDSLNETLGTPEERAAIMSRADELRRLEAEAEGSGKDIIREAIDDTRARRWQQDYEREVLEHKERMRAEAGLAAPSRSFGDRNTLVTRDAAQAALETFNKKLKGDVGALGPLDAVPEIVRMSAFMAEALAREAATIAVDFGQWSARVTRTLAERGLEITEAELKRLWNSPQVLAARMAMTNQLAISQAPRARGQLGAFVREAKSRGYEAWHMYRRTMEDIDLETRLIHEDEGRRFGKWYHKIIKRPVLTKAERQTLPLIAEVVTKDRDGNLQFGGIVRADVVKNERGQGGIEYHFGQKLDDGRIVGAEFKTPKGKGTGTFQTYRALWPDEAQALYQEFRQVYPNAARTLDDFLSYQEAPIASNLIEGGIAPFARDILKDRYNVEGLTQAEVETAAAAIERAYGNEAAQHGGIPMRMLWVPDYITQTHTFVGRVRNSFKHYLAAPKMKKSGATRERVLKGEVVRDFAKGTTRARVELMRESRLNSLADALVRVLAEERPRDAAGRLTTPTGYVPLSRALYGADSKWLTWAERHWQPLKDFGIDINGESHMIPSKVVSVLSPFFSKKAESTNPRFRAMVDILDKASGEMLTMVQGGLLTAPLSAVKNLVTNTLLASTKVTRDFFLGVYNTALWNQGDAPIATNWSSFVADVNPMTATRTAADTLLETAHMDPRFGTPPVERVGTSFWKELAQGGMLNPINRAINIPLRYMFQPPDVYARKWVTEAAQQASANRAWLEAKKAKAVGDLTRDEFIKSYRAAIPDAINNLAWSEMDTFGAYDYWNVNRPIETLKTTKTGRALVLYPTYVYKLINNTYGELIGPRTQADVFGFPFHRDRKRLARGLAGLSTAAVMFKMAGEIYDLANGEDAPLPEGVKEGDLSKMAASQGLQDVSKRGRLRIPGTADDEGNSLFTSVVDLPFFNEQMIYRELHDGKYDPADHLNQLLSSGPLFNYVALMSGMADKFNQGKAYGTRLGSETAGYVPFAKYSRLARILRDPYQRDVERIGQSEWVNFRNAFMDNYPWLSTQMREKVSTRSQSAKVYDKQAATLSFLILNTKRIDEADREWLTRAARVEWMNKVRSQYNEDIMREDIKVMMDLDGKTPATRILGEKASDDQELEARFQRARLAMLLEDEFRSGGMPAAKTRLKEELRGINDAIVIADLATYFPSFLTNMAERYKLGRGYETWKSLKPRQKAETADIMQQSIPTWQRRTGQTVEGTPNAPPR